MSQHTLTVEQLHQFTGTENYYRHALARDVVFSDGAKHVADAGGAYWLLDEIALAQRVKAVAAQAFQFWCLTVKADASATLVCEDGNSGRVYAKDITWTDFPLSEVVFYCVGKVIHLPSEY